jgi:hypothetical protein
MEVHRIMGPGDIRFFQLLAGTRGCPQHSAYPGDDWHYALHQVSFDLLMLDIFPHALAYGSVWQFILAQKN